MQRVDGTSVPVLIEETILRSDAYVFPIELPAGQNEADWAFDATVKPEPSSDAGDVLASFTFDTSAWPVVTATLAQDDVAALPDRCGAALRLSFEDQPTTVMVWTWKVEDTY